MVSCKHLTVMYGENYGIKSVDFFVKEGNAIAIVGQSGCGKTTLLETIAGLIEPTSGFVKVDGNRVIGAREKTAIVLQNDGLFPWKTVLDNVLMPKVIKGNKNKVSTEEAMNVLDSLGIVDQKDKWLKQLSVGQKKRVAIGRALLQEPNLMLLDEPTASLDMISKEAVQNNILKIIRERNVTLIIVTHDIEEAVFLGQKIYIMKDGMMAKKIENPTFGQRDVRENMAFYDVCLKVRKGFSS